LELLDVLIIGGGPAGSTCARILSKNRLSVLIVDKAKFPRKKLCAGWVTPEVFKLLSISPEEYSKSHILQPISKFIVWDSHNNTHPVDFGRTVSYGIIRREFDAYLLGLSGVKVSENFNVKKIEFLEDRVVVNDSLEARMLVGAGGHFCPASKALGNSYKDDSTLATLESETELDSETINRTVPYPGAPEVIYLKTVDGYAWYFSKGNYLNIGIGSLNRKKIHASLNWFLKVLKEKNRLTNAVYSRLNPFTGHFYKIYSGGSKIITADRAILAGDSAGLADSTSGEGIRPAVVSGFLAAEAIIEAEGDYSAESLSAYKQKIREVFGKPGSSPPQHPPNPFVRFVFKRLLLGTGMGRNILIKKYFLKNSLTLSPHRQSSRL